MKTPLLIVLILTFATGLVFGEYPKIEMKPADTIGTLLMQQVGQKVELHLKSGEKIGGKVESASQNTAHISSVTGSEFFDAVVSVVDISAVLVRSR